MSVTFPRVPYVQSGDLVTSTQKTQLANAVNARLISGIGEGTYRIWQLAYNLFRQVQRTDGNNWHTEGEFFWYYMLIEKNIDQHWPVAAPEDESGDGGNFGCPGVAFVLGTPAEYPEGDRVSAYPTSSNTTQPSVVWNWAKLWRGAYDNGQQGSPAADAAESYFRIVQPEWSPHGKSYGGYQPAPHYLGDCGSGEYASWQYIFTPIYQGLPLYVFSGSCPPGTSGFSELHVQSIADLPFAWYVRQWNGTVTRIPKNQYLWGPYRSGGRLYRPEGQQLARFYLNNFIKDFRGTPEQRPGGDFDIEEIAFPFEEFLSGQYLCAPNIGTVSGGEITPLYPSFSYTGATTHAAGSTTATHAYANGFVLGGVLMVAEKLVGSVTVEILDAGQVIDQMTLVADQNGHAEKSRYWLEGRSPQPLQFRLLNTLTFQDSSGTLTIESTEQRAMNPQIHDAYWVLRLLTAKQTGFEHDTSGDEWSLSRQAFNRYMEAGWPDNMNGALAVDTQTTAITPNPVYDAARRFLKSHLRLVRTQELIGYELVNGKSVMYFKRYAMGDRDADIWEGIADEITHVAPPGGTTNQWLMFPQFKRAKPGTGAPWSPESNAFHYSFCERCHHMNAFITAQRNPDLLRHFRPISAELPRVDPLWLFAPESPTSYRYAGSSQTLQGQSVAFKTAFYKSCRVYEPDGMIESVEAGNWLGHSDAVKVTFFGRLHYCDEAPATISSNVGAWDITALKAETYRSTENAIREYLVYQATGSPPSVKIGDSASQNVVSGAPYGAAWGHYFFTKLVPLPYEDGNSTEEDTDELVTMDFMQQIEWYLRAMCEGFVDRQTSIDYACEEDIPETLTNLVDFSWENINAQAHGTKAISILSSDVTLTDTKGFGPLPNTIMWSDVFNQLASVVNMMTRARLMLPHKLQCRGFSYQGVQAVAASWDPGAAGTSIVIQNHTSAGAGTPIGENDEWQDCFTDFVTGRPAVGASTSVVPDGTKDGGNYNVITRTDKAQYRFTIQDPLSLLALPPTLYGLVDVEGVGFIGIQYSVIGTTNAIQVSVQADAEGCCHPYEAPCSGHWWDGGAGEGYRFESGHDPNVVYKTCGLFTVGTLDPGVPPASDLAWGVSGTALCPKGASVSVKLQVRGESPESIITVPLVDP